MQSVDKIDFVILWVDGDDPKHKAKRQKYLQDFSLLDNRNQEQSTDERRFIQLNELKYCLRSIKYHAPWYNKIWLVTDEQIPHFLNPLQLKLDKIEIIDHQSLFADSGAVLPTFNTRSITTVMANIPGLSEHFIYGNDDLMLGSRIEKTFFYENGKPVVYADWQGIPENQELTLYQLGILNAAKMVGFSQSRFLMSSHGFQPMVKSTMQSLASDYSLAFQNNLRYRFRHESQFLPESLFNHHVISTNNGVLKDTETMVHFSFELCRIGAAEKIAFLFSLIEQGKRKMFCLNEYQSLLSRHPQVGDYLEHICGPALLSENDGW